MLPNTWQFIAAKIAATAQALWFANQLLLECYLIIQDTDVVLQLYLAVVLVVECNSISSHI